MTAGTPDTTADSKKNGAGAPDEGYTGTVQAARALNNAVSPKTIIRMVDRGELEGKRVQDGRARKVIVSIASLKRLRDDWVVRGKLDKEELVELDEAVSTSSDETDAIARAFERLAKGREDLAAEAADAKARLEITERAQSTMDAELRSERERREAAEREAERLRAELEAERRKVRGGFLRWLVGP